MSRIKTFGGAGTGTPAHAEQEGQLQINQASPGNQGAAFPLHCLPPEVEAMARAIAKAERTPESLAGCCTLGFLSAAIGAGLEILSDGKERKTRGNLFLVASAESGTGKSETYRHAATPFRVFEAYMLKEWREKILPGLLAEKDILESEIAKLKRGVGNADGAGEREEIKAQLEGKKAALAQVEASLCPPVLSVEDVTTEKLAVQLSGRGECLASLSADAGAIVNNLLGRYSKGDRTDESIYLKAFSGDPHRVDRLGRDSILLNRPCLSALWLVQPDKVESLLAVQSLTDGGLIPRMLICHTNAQPRPITKGGEGIPSRVVELYGELICNLLETYRRAEEPRIIHPSPEALEAMEAHFNGIVARRLGDLRDVTTFAARWNEQAWRIAVCLQAGSLAEQAHSFPLELETAQKAIEVADWFAVQQLEILEGGRQKARQGLRDKVFSFLFDHPEGIRASDVYRARIVRNSEEAHSLLAKLEAEGELTGREEKPEGGGHVTRIYTKARK